MIVGNQGLDACGRSRPGWRRVSGSNVITKDRGQIKAATRSGAAGCGGEKHVHHSHISQRTPSRKKEAPIRAQQLSFPFLSFPCLLCPYSSVPDLACPTSTKTPAALLKDKDFIPPSKSFRLAQANSSQCSWRPALTKSGRKAPCLREGGRCWGRQPQARREPLSDRGQRESATARVLRVGWR